MSPLVPPEAVGTLVVLFVVIALIRAAVGREGLLRGPTLTGPGPGQEPGGKFLPTHALPYSKHLLADSRIRSAADVRRLAQRGELTTVDGITPARARRIQDTLESAPLPPHPYR